MIGCCSLRGVLLFSEHVVSTWRAHGERMALFTFVCERVLLLLSSSLSLLTAVLSLSLLTVVLSLSLFCVSLSCLLVE